MNKRMVVVFTLALLALFSASATQAGTLFRLPLSSNPGYYAWYDHNFSAGSFQRYDCGTPYNYDGHSGTDFAVSIGTPIYAGANGSLYQRTDGCSDSGADQSCGSGYGNHVRIEHPSDLKVSIYAHMKNGTPAWYQSLLCGASIGRSGNSGTSSVAHLHFELWASRSIGSRIDFFGGSCSGSSYWVNQNGGWPTTTCQ